jgi:hypothetical protein
LQVSDDPYELAFNEAIRGLEQQDGIRRSYQDRAGTIILAATVATGFFAPLAWPAPHGARHDAALIAVGAFVVSMLAVLVVLRPRRGWEFANDPRALLQDYIEPAEGLPVSIQAIRRDLAIHLAESHDGNSDRLRELYVFILIAAGSLIIEMLAWILSLAL